MKLPEITPEVLDKFSVDRYEYTRDYGMEKHPGGDYVEYIEYDAIRKKIVRLEAEIERMRPVVVAAKAYETARNALSFRTKDGSNDYLFDSYNAAHVALIREVMNYEAKKP